ncbi:MAG: hypothetical protein HY001_05395 [Candidatus Portnoybacteria bacterium]|nr:hypothetical protein [Candidatus Portnoybacteria bacterium]
MTEEQKQRLGSLLASAGASADSRSFWLMRLERISSEACEKVMEFFESFPGEIENLRALQEKREQALSASDPALWEQFCKEEEEYFAKILASQA